MIRPDGPSDGPSPDETPPHDAAGPHTSHHEWEGPAPLSHTVATGVAAATDTDVTALPALYDAVDPESLDRLFRSVPAEKRERVEIAFLFAGCAVRVSGTGEVTVDPTGAPAGDG
ncbi:HalOD1 output domain-containing protein [Halorarius halobius]|uniref:HalOD1 output domain-containing protein n=1 Tax=Halorarius halobius TaxID=2962671 RepID=UPI0020CE4E58|nr:HalOD1 output domain-containing protein [Halorarius halobius]